MIGTYDYTQLQGMSNAQLRNVGRNLHIPRFSVMPKGELAKEVVLHQKMLAETQHLQLTFFDSESTTLTQTEQNTLNSNQNDAADDYHREYQQGKSAMLVEKIANAVRPQQAERTDNQIPEKPEKMYGNNRNWFFGSLKSLSGALVKHGLNPDLYKEYYYRKLGVCSLSMLEDKQWAIIAAETHALLDESIQEGRLQNIKEYLASGKNKGNTLSASKGKGDGEGGVQTQFTVGNINKHTFAVVGSDGKPIDRRRFSKKDQAERHASRQTRKAQQAKEKKPPVDTFTGSTVNLPTTNAQIYVSTAPHEEGDYPTAKETKKTIFITSVNSRQFVVAADNNGFPGETLHAGFRNLFKASNFAHKQYPDAKVVTMRNV